MNRVVHSVRDAAKTGLVDWWANTLDNALMNAVKPRIVSQFGLADAINYETLALEVSRDRSTWWIDPEKLEEYKGNGTTRDDLHPCSLHGGANLVGSKWNPDGQRHPWQQEWHYPCLDLDIPAKLIPSSTEGHSHLYLDAPCQWEDYKELLAALAKCNIISDAYKDHSIAHGMTCLRRPGVFKQGRRR